MSDTTIRWEEGTEYAFLFNLVKMCSTASPTQIKWALEKMLQLQERAESAETENAKIQAAWEDAELRADRAEARVSELERGFRHLANDSDVQLVWGEPAEDIMAHCIEVSK